MQKSLIGILNWFWIVFLPFLCFSSNEEPFVTCLLHGQLGNQLYQTATTIAYAWDYQVQPLFPELHRNEYGISENREHIFFRLNDSPLPRPIQCTFTESIWHSSEKVPFRPDQYLYGHFQSWIHFHHHRAKLLEVFAPSASMENYLKSKYTDILSNPKTVAIHVRTFNRETHDSGCFPFLGMHYYEQAMDLFPQDTLFVIFSDRIGWCKHHFPVLKKNMVYIEGNNHIQDLFLMSKMKHQIIANSSYSWWGAYLNTNPKKMVVAPRYWMHPAKYAFPSEQPNLFLLPEWIIVNPDYSSPYPEDIKWYDAYSQSIDTQ